MTLLVVVVLVVGVGEVDKEGVPPEPGGHAPRLVELDDGVHPDAVHEHEPIVATRHVLVRRPRVSG